MPEAAFEDRNEEQSSGTLDGEDELSMYEARRGVAPLLVLLCAAFGGGSASAAGFFLSQQSVTALGRGTAGGAAAASDASTIFFNPAGLTHLPGPEAAFGVSIISPRIDFDNAGSTARTPGTGGAAVGYEGDSFSNPYRPSPVPNLYLAVPVADERLWIGLGVTAPFGLSLNYPDGWFGRYDSIRARLRTVDIAPTVAVAVNEFLSLGAGLDIQYAEAMLKSAVPDPFAPGGPAPASDGSSRLEGDDWSVGFNVGALVRLTPDLRLGLHYRSGISHELEGDNEVSGLGGALTPFNGRTSGTTDLDLPDIVTVGAAYEATPALTVSGDFQWFNWSRFQEIRIRFANDPDTRIEQRYQDSVALALGADYAWSEALILRAGFRYESSPVRDAYRTTSVPDSDNYTVGLGASYRVIERLHVDVSLFGTMWEDADIDVTRRFFQGTAAASEAEVRARSQSWATTLALGVRWHF
jgi:long-chain fatty acid transport protein